MTLPYPRSFLPVAALVAGLLVLPACGGPDSTPSRTASGDVAPEFTLSDIHGDSVSLSDFEGQVLLIDFWATWCAPCREEIPMLTELHRTYGERGFTLLAISDENAELIAEFVAEYGVPYLNLVDPGEVSREYQVTSLPTAFLVDREGRIVEAFRGTKIRKVLEARIVELLDAEPAT